MLESGYCIGSLFAMLLHAILPEEEDPLVERREVVPDGRLYDPTVRRSKTKIFEGKFLLQPGSGRCYFVQGGES